MRKRLRIGHRRGMNENTKKLRRSQDQRILTGVCGGIGEYINVDANLIRLAFIIFTLFVGSGILLYIIAWLVIPERGAERSMVEEIIGSFTQRNSQ